MMFQCLTAKPIEHFRRHPVWITLLLNAVSTIENGQQPMMNPRRCMFFFMTGFLKHFPVNHKSLPALWLFHLFLHEMVLENSCFLIYTTSKVHSLFHYNPDLAIFSVKPPRQGVTTTGNMVKLTDKRPSAKRARRSWMQPTP